MLVLTIRTDKPLAEVGLYKAGAEDSYIKWEGHRQLSMTIHKKIEELLNTKKLKWKDIEGVVFFAGPGSFTGLRIGASVAGALAYGLDIPIVSGKGNCWIRYGIDRLSTGKNNKVAIPFYGSKPNITKPRK